MESHLAEDHLDILRINHVLCGRFPGGRQACTGTKRTATRRGCTNPIPVHRSTRSADLVPAVAPPEATTSAVRCTALHGAPTPPTSSRPHGRNDEGVYFWFADIDEDNDGYNTTDQGDGIVDAFPSDGTQWNDTDADGFGDNPAPANEPDACPNTPEPQPKTALDAPTATATVGRMKAIGPGRPRPVGGRRRGRLRR